MNNIIRTGDLVQTVYNGKEYTLSVSEILYAGGSMMCRVHHPELPGLIRVRDCAKVEDEQR
jgi:hypothetical protein